MSGHWLNTWIYRKEIGSKWIKNKYPQINFPASLIFFQMNFLASDILSNIDRVLQATHVAGSLASTVSLMKISPTEADNRDASAKRHQSRLSHVALRNSAAASLKRLRGSPSSMQLSGTVKRSTRAFSGYRILKCSARSRNHGSLFQQTGKKKAEKMRWTLTLMQTEMAFNTPTPNWRTWPSSETWHKRTPGDVSWALRLWSRLQQTLEVGQIFHE